MYCFITVVLAGFYWARSDETVRYKSNWTARMAPARHRWCLYSVNSLNCTCNVLYQMTLAMKGDEVVGRSRGCLMGNKNYTCVEAAQEEQCTTLDTGEKVSYDILENFWQKCRLWSRGRASWRRQIPLYFPFPSSILPSPFLSTFLYNPLWLWLETCGSAQAPPMGPGGTRPPNAFWCNLLPSRCIWRSFSC